MAKVQYRGTSHFREFSAKDFEGVGLEGCEDLRIARHDLPAHRLGEKDSFVAEVSDEQLKWLQRTYPGEWKTVSDEKAAQLEDETGDGEEVEVEMSAPETTGSGARAATDAGARSSSASGSGKTAARGSSRA